MGDFNARVGCGVRGDPWNGVCGCHGVGYVNNNGEALLSWCAQNGLVATYEYCVSEEEDTPVQLAAPREVTLHIDEAGSTKPLL